MAEISAVKYATVTVFADGVLSVTVAPIEPVSKIVELSWTDKKGNGSSSVIVTRELLSAEVALLKFERFTVNASAVSSNWSSRIAI